MVVQRPWDVSTGGIDPIDPFVEISWVWYWDHESDDV
jgi:hypothetical protein